MRDRPHVLEDLTDFEVEKAFQHPTEKTKKAKWNKILQSALAFSYAFLKETSILRFSNFAFFTQN